MHCYGRADGVGEQDHSRPPLAMVGPQCADRGVQGLGAVTEGRPTAVKRVASAITRAVEREHGKSCRLTEVEQGVTEYVEVPGAVAPTMKGHDQRSPSGVAGSREAGDFSAINGEIDPRSGHG